jgi:RND family efflux transporter MFP subunit
MLRCFTDSIAMGKKDSSRFYKVLIGFVVSSLLMVNGIAFAEGGDAPKGPPPVPVQVASVVEEAVSGQVTLVGTTEAFARSIIAAEVSGLVETFPVREGDSVEKGKLLAKLKSTDVLLRLKAAKANREKVLANIDFVEKELARYTALKEADSIAARKYDEVWYDHKALNQERLRTEAEIDLLKDELRKKNVTAPFSGFVAEEHIQVGEWVSTGGPVVTLVDLKNVKITVDVPERYATQLRHESPVQVLLASVSEKPVAARISAILPEGDPNSRTFPVHVELKNPDYKIKSGMEARARFNLGTKKKAILIPKDAVVTSGANRLVFVLTSGVVQPVPVKVTGYYGGNVAVEGPLKPGDQVVVRGNERLQPGQAVQVLE